MTFVIKHSPTGLYLGSDEDHIIADDALQFTSRGEAADYMELAVNALHEFEIVPNDPTRSNHIKLAGNNQPPNPNAEKNDV